MQNFGAHVGFGGRARFCSFLDHFKFPTLNTFDPAYGRIHSVVRRLVCMMYVVGKVLARVSCTL